jgi:hypothetical protein
MFYDISLIVTYRTPDDKTEVVVDMSEVVYDIKHTTSIEYTPTTLKFKIPPLSKDNKLNSDKCHITIGACVQFKVNKVPVFLGYVFNMTITQDGTIDVLCYDQIRYLKNKVAFIVGTDGTNGTKKTQTLKEVFNQICTELKVNQYKIEGEALNNTVQIPYKVFIDSTYIDVLKYCIDEVTIYHNKIENKLEPVYFILQDDYGVLTLTDIRNEVNKKVLRESLGKFDNIEIYPQWTGGEAYVNAVLNYEINNGEVQIADVKGYNPIIIGDESLLTEAKYKISIDDNVYNEIQLYTELEEEVEEKFKDADGEETTEKVRIKKGKTLQNIANNTLMDRWGTLRIMHKVHNTITESEMNTLLKKMLEVYSQPKRTLTINALGVTGVNAGTLIEVDISNFNKLLWEYGIIPNHNNRLWVVSAEHDYSNGHTMKLTMCHITAVIEGIFSEKQA